MTDRGMRAVLEYGLCLGAALLLHAALFLIPGVKFGTREPDTERGVRVRMYRPSPLPPPPVSALPSARAPAGEGRIREADAPPDVDPGRSYSRIGGRTGGDDLADSVQREAAHPGERGEGHESGENADPPAKLSEYGQYLSRLRSDPVQGWAKDSARQTSRGWRGTGAGGGSRGGTGPGGGTGGGEGSWGSGQGTAGAAYLDPRIQMVVTSYPRTGIESRFTRVAYPDLKFKKFEYTAGWWNVYIQIRTDRQGRIISQRVLRPETDGPLERQFVDQVTREIERWTFDPVEAEVIVDVRFYVE